MKTIKINISNLICEACVKLSKSRISKMDGVKDVKISGLIGETEIISDRDITLEEIKKALAGTNYKVTVV